VGFVFAESLVFCVELCRWFAFFLFSFSILLCFLIYPCGIFRFFLAIEGILVIIYFLFIVHTLLQQVWNTTHVIRRVWRYQKCNENPYFEGQAKQRTKKNVQNDKQSYTKHYTEN
jgi:hypothetical protein